ncbi:FAD-binding domain-containing protein [Xylaria cf. heliscus]|nr:FAD-binding domain-containing protein [Xylaria cf. heliscus]
MDLDFSTFCDSLEVSDAQSRTIGLALREVTGKGGPQGILHVACQTGRETLGEEQVEFATVNGTIAQENWSQTCVSSPYCIFLPRNTKEVSKAVKIVEYFEVKFAVRSGGHSPNPGWSNIGQGGILIDLQRLNQIKLTNDKSVVNLGPGARWGEVISTLGSHNLTVLGGRHPLVGVSGLILGGGYSHMTTEYGTVADNVKRFEVILADGSVVYANTTENEDLFWALKGGGPNFGIVTSIDMKTVPIYTIWYQLAIYSLDQSSEILDTFAKWQVEQGSSDNKANVLLSLGMDSHVVGLIYSAPSKQPKAFAPFYSLTPIQVVVPPTNGTFSLLNDATAAFIPNDHIRHDYRGVSSRVDARLYKEMFAFWLERAIVARDARNINQTFVMQHVPSNVAAEGVANGGNPMGIPPETHQWWTTLVDWRDAADDEVARQVSIETTEQFKKLGIERGLYLPFIYMNDAARDQNPIRGYGDDNINRLWLVARKYDPSGFFQTHQGGGFLLSSI